ncbi:HIT domain-containing protein [Pseudoxanthomonas suwonensis]|uniref:HIT domain-containing protein n=1 Tax=Pseudoxanthomonas suwonensis TaxID=314722 RepID=UPI001FECDBBB|nr:HIT domain-containing protein [Pseudoxanthomonas suwonensis]
MTNGGCVFCQILAGHAPASVVWEDAHVVALMDLRQAVPGHVLVIPRLHAETLYDLDEDAAAHLMRVAHRIALALRGTLDPDGLNLWQSNGEAGGRKCRTSTCTCIHAAWAMACWTSIRPAPGAGAARTA